MPRPIALTAYDDHPGYRGWQPLCKAAWERLGYEPVFLHATNGPLDHGTIRLPVPPHRSPSAVAKYGRLLWAAADAFRGRRVLLTDIDIIPVDPVHFAIGASGLVDVFMALGGDFFDIFNYFPTCYCVASHGVWREVLLPARDSVDWLQVRDGSTDEGFMKVALDMWGHPERTMVVPRWRGRDGQGADGRRMCKGNWKWDAEGLRAGRYIDIHLPLFGTVPQEQIDVIAEVVNAR